MDVDRVLRFVCQNELIDAEIKCEDILRQCQCGKRNQQKCENSCQPTRCRIGFGGAQKPQGQTGDYEGTGRIDLHGCIVGQQALEKGHIREPSDNDGAADADDGNRSSPAESIQCCEERSARSHR